MTRIGSLFSGYGGLDMGVQSVLGGTVAWHCDFDTGPSRVLAHHWPDVPNLVDVTKVDWATVEPVDVITGGSPCQDVSAAGKRAGMRAGTRSGLWASMCDAIDIIRPGLVVWENVQGALSAAADSAVEPCPICVGDAADVHLRALSRVVGDLSEIGYDSWWTTLRASDAGAPHARARVFVFAWPAGHAADSRRNHARPTHGRGERAWATGGSDLSAPADAGRFGLEAVGGPGGPESELPRAASHRGNQAPPDADDRLQPHLSGGVAGPQASGEQEAPRTHRGPQDRGGGSAPDVQWGDYGPAVERWERVLGRPAPAPTEPGRTGQPRLSPRFVEWLMGLPDGHVTAVPDLTRNEQLKLLGNGVVWQQCALATHMWMEWMHDEGLSAVLNELRPAQERGALAVRGAAVV